MLENAEGEFRRDYLVRFKKPLMNWTPIRIRMLLLSMLNKPDPSTKILTPTSSFIARHEHNQSFSVPATKINFCSRSRSENIFGSGFVVSDTFASGKFNILL